MIDAAIVLAGGVGSRLAPWPAPKCLLPIRGVSILERIVGQVSPRVRKIVVCVGYRARDVISAVEDGRSRRTPVVFSCAGEDATMGERLSHARCEQPTGRILVLYGDEMADVDLDALERQHEADDKDMTYAAHEETLPFGVVRDDGSISSSEKVLVNVGYALVEPGAWELLRTQDGLSDWVSRVARASGVSVYKHAGRRATVNSLNDLARAEETWS